MESRPLDHSGRLRYERLFNQPADHAGQSPFHPDHQDVGAEDQVQPGEQAVNSGHPDVTRDYGRLLGHG